MVKNVLIVGLGLLGGSYAKGLTKKGYYVMAIDPNETSIALGLSEKFIAVGAVTEKEDMIATADLIVFAAYPDLMLGWMVNFQKYFKEGAIVTDVLGVKGDIVIGMEKILRDDVHYCGSHPMAGKEVSGAIFSDENMFHKANFILTPTENTPPIAVAMVEKMAEDLEFRQISHLSPQDHDKAIGFLSQLTHVIAVTLMNCRESEEFIKYTGDSFRDLTRIAMINENLWSQLFLANKSVLLEEIDVFSKELQDFREILETEDLEKMKEKFIVSTNRRKKYQK